MGFESIIIFLVVVVWIAICWVKIHQKMGISGGSAFIPFYGPIFSGVYGGYTIYKHVWETKYFFIALGILIADIVFFSSGVSVFVALSWVLTIALIVFIVIIDIKLAKAFGRGVGFAMGLLFLFPIFIGILAFGEAQYKANMPQVEQIHEPHMQGGVFEERADVNVSVESNETNEPWR